MWIPGMASGSRAPLRACRAAGGCRCDVVVVMSAESGAAEIARLIRARGGRASRAEIDAAPDNPKAAARALRAREDAAGEKIRAASACEKDDPRKAVELYREAIREYRDIAPSGDQWMWRHFPNCFNRMSMILERLGEHEKALAAIEEFRSLPWDTHATKAESDAIEKRLARMRERLRRRDA